MLKPTWQQVAVILALLAVIFGVTLLKGSSEVTALVGVLGIMVAWFTDRGGPPPPPPPPPPAILGAIIPFLIYFAVGCSAKYPELPPEGLATSGLVTLAQAFQATVHACAVASDNSGGYLTPQEQARLESLAENCYAIAMPGKDALAHASQALNVWTSTSQQRIGCDTKAIVQSVKGLQVVMMAYGVRQDKKVTDMVLVAEAWTHVLANWALPTCDADFPTNEVYKRVIPQQ